VLNETRYGAQSTTQHANVKNHLLAVGYGRFEQPINSISIAQSWGDQAVNFSTVSEAILSNMKDAYGKQLVEGQALADWVHALWEEEDQLQKHYQKAQKDCETYLRNIKILKK